MVGESLLKDPLTLALILFILALVFFFYLFLRRTVLGFREGFESGKRGKER
jgi:ABC-type uncharacterized transport system permease subunit